MFFMFLSKLGNFKEAEFESKKVLNQTLHRQNCTHSYALVFMYKQSWGKIMEALTDVVE